MSGMGISNIPHRSVILPRQYTRAYAAIQRCGTIYFFSVAISQSGLEQKYCTSLYLQCSCAAGNRQVQAIVMANVRGPGEVQRRRKGCVTSVFQTHDMDLAIYSPNNDVLNVVTLNYKLCF